MTKYFAILLAFSYTMALAQPPAGSRPGGYGGNNAINGRFYGRIVDTKTNKGIDASSIQLIQTKFNPQTKEKTESILSGQLTKANGDFSLENLPTNGEMKLKITAIGYLTIEKTLKFQPPNFDIDQIGRAHV